MWIEVIGLPGVGKTTLIEKHISLIEENYTVIQSDQSSFFQKIITKVLYYFYYRLLSVDKNLAKKLAYRHGFRILRNRNQNVFFYDSGMTQALLENLIETNFQDNQSKTKLLSKLSLPNLVIYLKDDIEKTASREINRDKSRFDLSLEDTIERYKQAEKWIEKELLQSIEIIDIMSPHNDQEFIKALKREKTL